RTRRQAAETGPSPWTGEIKLNGGSGGVDQVELDLLARCSGEVPALDPIRSVDLPCNGLIEIHLGVAKRRVGDSNHVIACAPRLGGRRLHANVIGIIGREIDLGENDVRTGL